MLVLALFAAPSARFDAMVAAHRGMRSFHCHIELSATISGRSQRTTYDMDTDRNRLILRVRQPQTGDLAKSDKTFAISGEKFTAYDAVAGERLDRTLTGPSTLVDKVTSTLGVPDDMIRYLLDPAAMQKFVDGFKGAPGWQVRRVGPLTQLLRDVGKGSARSHTLFAVESDTSRLRQLDVSGPGNEVHWRFQFAPVGNLSYQPPISARRVKAFTVAAAPPKYADAGTAAVVAKMVAAYQNLSVGQIDVEDDEGQATIAFAGRKLAERQLRFAYAYDGETLTIWDKQKKAAYRGKTVRSLVPDLVAEVGGRADSISRQMLQRHIPFKELLIPNALVSTAGQMQSEGINCTIVKIELPRARISMFVRSDNHLIDSAATDSLDEKGHVIASSQRRFRYRALPGNSSFHLGLPKGIPILPLPKLNLYRG